MSPRPTERNAPPTSPDYLQTDCRTYRSRNPDRYVTYASAKGTIEQSGSYKAIRSKQLRSPLCFSNSSVQGGGMNTPNGKLQRRVKQATKQMLLLPKGHRTKESKGTKR